MGKYRETLLYAIFAGIVIYYVFMQVQPKVADFFDVQKSLNEKRNEIVDLERRVDQYKASATAKEIQLVSQIKKIYKPERPGLDAESSFNVMFDDVIEIAKNNGIKIFSMEYVYNPPTDEFVVGSPHKFNVCQLNLQTIGNYNDIEGFFQDLYKYPYLINMENVELMPYENDKTIVLGKLEVKLYSSK